MPVIVGQVHIPSRVFDMFDSSSYSVEIISKKIACNCDQQVGALKNHTKNLLSNRNGIFLFVNGTGQLYKLIKGPGSNFKRIDSTLFWGYNNGCFPFSYKDEIYTLGGSGLWRTNGQLRKYNYKSHEWDIIPLNKEIPISFGPKEGIMWYDQIHSAIYTGNYTPSNSAISDKSNYKIVQECLELNLNTNIWSYKGDLTSTLIDIIGKSVNVAATPYGILIGSQLNFYLIDFYNNRILQPKRLNPEFQTLIKGNDSSIIFYNKNFFFKTDGKNLDSIRLDINEWINTGPVYETKLFTHFSKWRIQILFVLLLFFIYLGFKAEKVYRSHLLRKYVGNSQNSNQKSTADFPNYSETEWLLIKLIYFNSINRNKTTIDEINGVLGLQNRSIEIQKAQRHKNLSSINKKFIDTYNRQLISNEKLAIDRRSFTYYIEESNCQIIKNELHNKLDNKSRNNFT
jgi:hypothetical protein